jgi:hypothetical protein
LCTRGTRKSTFVYRVYTMWLCSQMPSVHEMRPGYTKRAGQRPALVIVGRPRHTEGMPKRSSKKKPEDEAPPAAEAVPPADAPPAEGGKNPAAVALGRLGGKKGGKARAAKLTAERRREIAKKAAAARWKKR